MSLLLCLLVDTLLADPMYYLPLYLLPSKHLNNIPLIMFNISQAFRNLDNVILNPLLCRYTDLIVCVCVINNK